MQIKVGREAIAEAHKKLSNWARWGKDDQIGTLNLITPQDIDREYYVIDCAKHACLSLDAVLRPPAMGWGRSACGWSR